MPTPFRTTKDGIVISVRLLPGASRDEIVGPEEMEDGVCLLRVRVRARPEKGKANQALCFLLAKYFKLPKSDFEVISGHKSRRKTVLIRNRDEELVQKLKAISR